jgi:alkylated DNA nucleotide flippase Atl1
MKKTWAQKIEDRKNFPKVLKLERRFPCFSAVRKMGADEGDPVVLVNASEILPIMAGVPKGRLVTIREICLKIAQKHRVKGCCSLVTGILIMSIANAAEEAAGKKEKSALASVPYWRTLKVDGFLNEKYPGGSEEHKRRLEKEGHQIISRGKKYQVADLERYLWDSEKRMAAPRPVLTQIRPGRRRSPA